MGAVETQGRERVLIARTIEDLSDAQLVRVPDRHRNNILWNLGHIVCSHQFLLYKNAGLPMSVSGELVAGRWIVVSRAERFPVVVRVSAETPTTA